MAINAKIVYRQHLIVKTTTASGALRSCAEPQLGKAQEPDMSKSDDKKMQSSRRNFLVGAGGVLAATGIAAQSPATASPEVGVTPKPSALEADIEPFFGAHQGGIATAAQTQTYFAVFDLQTEKVEDVKALLRRWTDLAAKLSTGVINLSQSSEI